MTVPATGGRAKRHCGVCAAAVPPPFQAPQPEIAPDLDMRPGEPARSTLSRWVAVCRSCGAAAPDLSALPATVGAIVRSAAYRTLAEPGPPDTMPFRRWALLCQGQGDRLGEAEALLQAAWAADDAGADDAGADAAAITLRQTVAALWENAADTRIALRRLDVLRRAGQFEEAEQCAEGIADHPLDDTARAVLAFQRGRIAAGDRARHSIGSALPPPAHAPHVTHVRRTSPGLWRRLFGRG